MSEAGQQWEIMVEQRVEALLRQLRKDNLKLISAKILALATNPRPSDSVRLICTENMYRLDVADWRISYAVEDHQRQVIIVGLDLLKSGAQVGDEPRSSRGTASILLRLTIGEHKRDVEVELGNAVQRIGLDKEIEAVLGKVIEVGRQDLYVPLLFSAGELMTKLRDPEFGNAVFLGCYDMMQGHYVPQVDLRVDGGAEKGVTWPHAKIFRKNDEVFILDMSNHLRLTKYPDKNVTLVNGKRIGPREPEPLNSGDQLMLGELPIAVMIAEADR